LNENLTLNEQAQFITLLNKIDGRGVYEEVETTGAPVDPEQRAIAEQMSPKRETDAGPGASEEKD